MRKAPTKKSEFGIPSVLLLGLTLLALMLRFWHINQSAYPLALDPYYHMANSAYLLDTGHLPKGLAFNVIQDAVQYPPLLSVLGAVFAKLGVPLITFYRYAALAITALIGVLFYVLGRSFLTPVGAAISAGVYLFLPYSATRMMLTLPENLNLVFLLGIGCLLSQIADQNNSQKGTKNQWWQWIMIALLLILSSLTHTTYILGVVMISVFGMLTLVQRKKWLLVGLVVILALILGRFFAQTVPGNWHFIVPEGTLLTKYFGDPTWMIGIIGALGLLVSSFRKDPWHRVALISIIGPILLLWLGYQGQSGQVGSVEPQRVFIFVGWLIAFGVGWFFDWLWKVHRWGPLLGLALAVLVIQPKWTDPWPEVFSPAEVEAAMYIERELPKDALYFSEPIMEWLVRGVAHRSVIWDAYDGQARIKNNSPLQLALLAQKFRYSQSYIVFSKAKNDPTTVSRLSDGTSRAINFSDTLETPGINEAKFSCLPLIWQNTDVTIYALTLPDAETCQKTIKRL